MQWMLVRVLIEACVSGGALGSGFAGCSSSGDMLVAFERFSELERMGVIVGAALLVTTAIDLVALVYPSLVRLAQMAKAVVESRRS